MSSLTGAEIEELVDTCERIKPPRACKAWADLAVEVHRQNARWWKDPASGNPITRDESDLRMLIASEINEAFESYRRGDRPDDHLPHRRGTEVELADAVIRCLDVLGHRYGEGDFVDLAFEMDDIENWGRRLRLSVFILPVSIPKKLLKLLALLANENEDSGQSVAIAQFAFICMAIDSVCLYHGYDLWGAVSEKLAYNQRRVDHTDAARLAEGGKKL